MYKPINIILLVVGACQFLAVVLLAINIWIKNSIMENAAYVSFAIGAGVATIPLAGAIFLSMYEKLKRKN